MGEVVHYSCPQSDFGEYFHTSSSSLSSGIGHLIGCIFRHFANIRQLQTLIDLHSDLGALCRCHRVDWDELALKLERLERDGKRAWEHYQVIFKTTEKASHLAHK
ncbi:unnamed protein product [Protopolystoma xenopodis]|uniref:Uncharacterized protein n=1 Tax=Protopolystoma xenopodis TaxID=117903 RepID=A0A3S5BRA0_9PLAT|nr:unnamed protein product [Protopolystoma xenopodis]